MAKYITQLQVSLNEHQEEQLRKERFIKIDVNLNENSEGKKIYLWYKEGSSSPITRIQFSFNDEMSEGLSSAGFTKVDKNISVAADGDRVEIYLWYLSGKTQYDIPIVEVWVTLVDDPQVHKLGLERMTCYLNQIDEENQIFLWMGRETKYYLHDITATNSYENDRQYFMKGYVRDNKSTNGGAGGANVFIWYRVSPERDGDITNLGVSKTKKECEKYKKNGFTQVDQNLIHGIEKYPNYLWFKKDANKPPIACMSVMFYLFRLPFRRFPKAS